MLYNYITEYKTSNLLRTIKGKQIYEIIVA